ncbi:MAG: DUF397 domain-containing protein [Actinomycetota bacterium]|nr:DUF397 domain-containing protein [Actinomycetota bacterium]
MDTSFRDVRWIKSSFSGDNGSCVELAALDEDRVGVRNSNRPQAGTVMFTRAELAAFLAGAKAGEFDHLA